ncbi:MAG: hypothetical protein WCX97_04885 [Candidatus Magasanikbacteria bacterium]|jgi:hypothetical protein
MIKSFNNIIETLKTAKKVTERIIGTITILLFKAILIGLPCYATIFLLNSIKGERWQGYYYPNEDNLAYNLQSPEFKSLEECRFWVNSQVAIYNPAGYGYDYECGKNCKFNKDFEAYVCKETIK